MDFQEYSICKPDNVWFEKSCNTWAEHYNFLLGLPYNTESENAWFRDQFNSNKIYDV